MNRPRFQSSPIKGRIYRPVRGSIPFYEVACDQATYDQLLKQAANAKTYVWRQAGAGAVCDEVCVGEPRAKAALAAIGIVRPAGPRPTK